jgi:predicted branched-subunit amino acid permease
MTFTITAPSRRSDATAGAIAMAPFVLGFAPFALLIGSTAAAVHEPVAGWAGSWLIFAGSAHLVALQGIASGSVVVTVVTALLVNARLLVYGASVAPQWRGQPRWFRAVGAALLVDPTWAVLGHPDVQHMSRARQRRFFLGAALTLGVTWSAMIGLGVIAGHRLPDVGLELAAPLCLIALIGRRLVDREHRWAATCAATVAIVTLAWPAGTGVCAAIASGCVAAAVARRTAP